ncbi:hypothetical protein [Terrimonas sp.]|nr:hypothetical protein [Terrimonas sp.]
MLNVGHITTIDELEGIKLIKDMQRCPSPLYGEGLGEDKFEGYEA